jgi:hypothetical protein
VSVLFFFPFLPQDLLKVLYVDPNLTHLCDKNLTVYGSPDKNGGGEGGSSFDTSNGVRCLRVSHDGKHLASGDRAGNIRCVGTFFFFSSTVVPNRACVQRNI